MNEKFFPESLYENGFTDLISVVPPGAQLTPTSKIPIAAIGKAPGRKLANGMYAGYNWIGHDTQLDDVKKWCVDGANIGLRAARFPGVDIDVTDEGLAQIIENAAREILGVAPVRVGRAPKKLLMFRTDEPFGRMRLWIDNKTHLVEVLGQGQQYLVHGVHPGTMRPYEWTTDISQLKASDLPVLTREKAEQFLAQLEEIVGMVCIGVVEREGDGRVSTRTAGDQSGLLAPSIEMLRDVVRMIPNTNDIFPDRTSYLKMGYAVKAAAGGAEEGYDIFAEWAEKWEGNDRFAGNDAEVVRGDWDRMTGDKSVGWGWIAETARTFGFNDAALEFEALTPAPEERTIGAAINSEQWLAQRVIDAHRGELRYIPERGQFIVWDGARWRPDAQLLAEDMINRALLELADEAIRHGATEKEKKEALTTAQWMLKASTSASVRTFVKANRAIAVGMESLDHDIWVINTPGGIVDLKTGRVSPPNPDALCTKSTSVPADFNSAAPEWRRFLAEATGGDRELELFLQRLSGYCLTGSTEEQNLTFIHGGGGNGKGTFLNTISAILGDYARVAQMDTFTASHGDKHPTDVAMLVGARLVTASETQAGKRWDEAKVKSMTGGDPITARFMRQDSFTYMPQFKLVFIGNHKPEIRDIDDAMKRRVQIVPFTIKPSRVDKHLGMKLREEWPAILAWMVEGCLAWQKEGLKPPKSVLAATDEYFTESDSYGRWMAEALEEDDGAVATSQELFESYRQWANASGEFVGSMKRLSSALVARKVERWRDPASRKMGFKGLRVVDALQFPVA